MLSLPRASPATRAAAEPHPGTRRGQRDPRHGGPSTSPPGTATLTSLHGEEEEEEGSGGAAPTASGYGPAARQPGHGFASASAGFRRGTGVRCPPGVYVGHEPSQPARPRRHIDWWKLGPAVTKGTASSPRPSHPDPGPQPRTPAWRDGVCPGEPRRGTGASPFAACSRSRRALPCRAAALRRAEASCVATALCAARPPGRGSGVFAFRAQLAVASPLPPGSWVFMPAADHHHGIRAAGRNCLPFSQPLQPRGCLHRASALCRPPLAPRPLRWLLGGLRNGAGAAFAPPPVALVPHAMAGAAQARGWGWCWVPPPCCRRWAPLWKRLLAQLEQVGWERGVSAPHFWPQWYCGVGTQDWDPQPGQQTPQTAAA